MSDLTLEARHPAPMPRRMTHEAEFLRLMDQRRLIDIRLDELAALIDPSGTTHRAVATVLPRIELRLVGRRSRPAAGEGRS